MKKKKTQKERLIEKISAIIKKCGSVSTADLELSSSPIHKSISKDHYILIEQFNQDDVRIVTYVHETETNDDYIPYEEVSTENLKGILENLKEYAEQKEIDWEKTLKRCSN